MVSMSYEGMIDDTRVQSFRSQLGRLSALKAMDEYTPTNTMQPHEWLSSGLPRCKLLTFYEPSSRCRLILQHSDSLIYQEQQAS